MKKLAILLAFLLSACGPGGGDDTIINIAAGDESQAGDPITETNSECAQSDDQCAQQVDD